MKQVEFAETVRKNKVIAIVRGYGAEVCYRLAEAYARGGIRMMELPLDQTDGRRREEICATLDGLVRRFGGTLSLGAGTVLTQKQLVAAKAAGVGYVVMPHVDADLIAAADAHGLGVLPGAYTPTDIVAAWKGGAGIVKLFPAVSLGAAYVKSVLAPLRHIPLVAVGGLQPADVPGFLAAGCVGVGVGADLVNKEWIAAGAFSRIEAAAKAFVDAAFGRLAVAVACVLTSVFAAQADIFNPPEYFGPTDAAHARETRVMITCPSLAVAPNGRLWATWFTGPTPGEDHNGYVVLTTSGDDGKTWQEVCVCDPDGPGPRRAFDPQLWIAPDGKLRWTWTDRTNGMKPKTSRGNEQSDGLWMAVIDDPCGPFRMPPPPTCVAHGIMLGNPIVLSDGTWVLPTSVWFSPKSSSVTVSTDAGKTWRWRGGASNPDVDDRAFDEHNVIERKNGDLWCLSRTKSGLREAVSKDKGVTWTPLTPSKIKHTSSRTALMRLKSGNLLLVKHGPIDKNVGRGELTAFVSRDDGETWEGGLLLDERGGAAYPNGQQGEDGRIHMIYDYDRYGAQNVLFATFTEADVLAGKDVSGRVRYRQRINGKDVVARADLHVRDPFVRLGGGIYRLYASEAQDGVRGVVEYRSENLVSWSRYGWVLQADSVLGCSDVRSPEVHEYGGAFYMFATLTLPDGEPKPEIAVSGRSSQTKPTQRGVWVFRAKQSSGPYVPVSNRPLTPRDQLCSDGTLYVEDGVPYMVYCRERMQDKDGAVCYLPLKADFSGPSGESTELFRSSSAPNVAASDAGMTVADAPFLYWSPVSQRLYLIWSTFLKDSGYAVLCRTSRTGNLAGPWSADRVLFSGDGGHASFFRTRKGDLFAAFLVPNSPAGAERMRTVAVKETDDGLAFAR